uniref:Protein tyrosine phosphatase non-receptor type 20 n=2 Tax=Sus scrofa TaxID=9823 RepID=A0A8D1WB11_PIG
SWTTGGSSLKDSKDEELAGPSQTYIPTLQVQHHEYSGPNETTTLWNDPNKGAVYLLLNCT